MNNTTTDSEITVERLCSWHPGFFGTTLVMGTTRMSANLGTFGSHGACPACITRIKRENGLVK